MKVSVILPIYNVEPYLARSLDSLINQTLTDIEIICVNDASPDNSAQVLAEYAARDSRIKVINMPKNSGAAMARQAGLDIATGEYVGFVDPDDYVNNDYYKKLYELAKKEQADVVKGVIIETKTNGIRHPMHVGFGKLITENKFKFHGQALVNFIYKMDMIRKYNIHFEIDIFCFGLQVAYYANKIVLENDAVYNYMRREGSCDSNVFSVYKWEHWNVRGARYYMTLLNSLDYTPSDYVNIASDFVFPLYFWGYDRLIKSDRKKHTANMADYLLEFWASLKYQEMFIHKFAEYNQAIISGNRRKLIRLLKCRHIKPKFIRKILIRLFR